MAEEEPVARTRCQHCPAVIEQAGDLWRGLKGGQYVCDPVHLDIKHKPMPRIPA